MKRFFLAVATIGLIGLGSVPVSVAQEPKPDLTKVKEQVRIAVEDIEKEIERIEDPYRKCATLRELASARFFVGDRTAAVKALAKAADLRKKITRPLQQFIADVDFAGRYLEVGDLTAYREFEQRARQEMHSKDQEGRDEATVSDLLDLAHFEAKANDRAAARETLARALVISQSTPRFGIVPLALIQIAWVYQKLGDRDDAGAAIDKGLELVETTMKRGSTFALDLFVNSLVPMGFLDEALRIIALPKMAQYRLNLISSAAGRFNKSLQLKRPDFLDRLEELTKNDLVDDAADKDGFAAMQRKSLETVAILVIATAQARVGRVDDALRVVMPGLEKKDASSISVAALREIALARHRVGDHADAKSLLRTAFELLKPQGSANRLGALSKAQIEIGEIKDAAESVAAIAFSVEPKQADDQAKLLHRFKLRTETIAKAKALAGLARALTESGEKVQAQKRFQEGLKLIDSHQTPPFREFELREPLQELVLARSRLDSMAAGLEMLSRIKDGSTKLRMQLYILEVCSRSNDLKGIETLLEGLGESREPALWRAVKEEVSRGHAEDVVAWAPRLREPDARLWAVLDLIESLRALQDPEPADIYISAESAL